MRIAVSLAALVLMALAAWHFTRGDDEVGGVAASDFAQFERGDPGRALDATRPVRMARTSGLQTTVPDTIGYDEKTAIFTLEEGGFRVRVMNRAVSSWDDEDVVVQQLPRGGVTRRVGWIVTIVVGRLR